MTKKALITGITGQDGAYLAELLLAKGYQVHGVKRRSSSFNTGRIDHIYQDPHESGAKLHLHYGDMTDSTNLIRIVQEVVPDEIYNLAAQSHVQVSFDTPEYTANADAVGTLRLLEAVKILGLTDRTRFYQASTSELYGLVQEVPQRETTPFYPRSPYAAAKLYAYWITVNYREAYGMFASNGILFNHESPIRGETFVTRKITRAVSAIYLGIQDRLWLGNLDAQRDWGHARDYVEGMWRILQHDRPDDFVLATGQTQTVRLFVERAFAHVGVTLDWQGEGVDERGICANTGKTLVEVDARYFRPTEVDLLIGDPTKAKTDLGWEATTSFEQLVTDMMEADLKTVAREAEHRRVDEESALLPRAAPDMAAYDLVGRRVWVAGHKGMVGQALVRRLERENCEIIAPRERVDLRRQAAVETWMREAKPDLIFVAAAKVGGIHANDTLPGEFLYDNLMIEANIIEAARHAGASKLVFLGSSCIYPKFAPQPMTEDALLTGPLEPTNEWYAVAKIAGIKLCQAYRKQYGLDFISAQPTNLYGPFDNFDLTSSHVLPALIRKAHEAKLAGAETFTIWGSGTPLREFLHVDDLADALVFLARNYSAPDIVNIGSGAEVAIGDLADIIGRAVGFEGEIIRDASKPDGTPRKLLDTSKLEALGWRASIDLRSGIESVYSWYREALTKA